MKITIEGEGIDKGRGSRSTATLATLIATHLSGLGAECWVCEGSSERPFLPSAKADTWLAVDKIKVDIEVKP